MEQKTETSALFLPPQRVAVLILQGRPEKTKDECTYKTNKNRISIGSAESSDVRLEEDDVAPLHAVLEIDGTAVHVYDLASESGVQVNGLKTVSGELKAGDTLSVGRHRFKFFLEDVQKTPSASDDRLTSIVGERWFDDQGRKLFLQAPLETPDMVLLEDRRGLDPIIELASEIRPAVEVMMTWNGLVLAVEHFEEDGTITLGSDVASTFVVPAILSTPQFELLRRSGSQYSLKIDPKMKGILYRKGKLTNLAETPASQIVLEFNDLARVEIGDVVLYVSFTHAPPRLKRPKLVEKDSLFHRILTSSLALALLLLWLMLSITVTDTVQIEELPDRVATILYEPEKYQYRYTPETGELAVPEPLKPQVPQKSKLDLTKPQPETLSGKGEIQGAVAKRGKSKGQSQAREGEGARARGNEGLRGSRTAKPGKDAQTAATRPSTQQGAGRGGTRSEEPGVGNIESLKGFTSKFENLLAGGAEKLGKSGDRVKGYGGFDTQGEGGLALSGKGSGGGGTQAVLGGLGNKGQGGGRIGTGFGAVGKGNAIVGGSTRVVLRTGDSDETVVMGAIDPAAVNAALAAHKDEFRFCYERELNAGSPKLRGTVYPSFVIGAQGAVTRAGIASSSLKNPGVEQCVVNVIRRIPFPSPRGGGIVEVRFRIEYSPTVGG